MLEMEFLALAAPWSTSNCFRHIHKGDYPKLGHIIIMMLANFFLKCQRQSYQSWRWVIDATE